MWQPYLASLPQQTETPILWTDKERKEYLRGSAVGGETVESGVGFGCAFTMISSIHSGSSFCDPKLYMIVQPLDLNYDLSKHLRWEDICDEWM